VPLMGVVQIAALVTAVADDVPAIAGTAGWIAYRAARALVDSAGLVTLAPWSVARVPPPAILVVATYYAALAAIVLCNRPRSRKAAAVVWAVAALVVIGVLEPRLPSSIAAGRPLRLTMLDVGQGESILIETPSDRRLLIDTGGAPFGGSFGVGARVIAPALWTRGIRSLDVVVVTHGDPDHLGGALDVLNDFTPRRIWMGVPMPNHRPTQDVHDAAARLAIPIDLRRTGEIETDGEVRMRVLHPPSPDWERRRVRNDDSVVLEVLYRDVALLLTGDISSDIEREILPHLTQAPIRVLKVAHHGSRTSSSQELLSAWRPQIALISAGRGNTFGHPATEVLRRLEAIGATVLRTDRHGQIGVETDGRQITFTTFQAR